MKKSGTNERDRADSSWSRGGWGGSLVYLGKPEAAKFKPKRLGLSQLQPLLASVPGVA